MDKTRRKLNITSEDVKKSSLPDWVKTTILDSEEKVLRRAVFSILGVIVGTGVAVAIILPFLILVEPAPDWSFWAILGVIPLSILGCAIIVVSILFSKNARTCRHYKRYIILGVDDIRFEILEQTKPDAKFQAKVKSLRIQEIVITIIWLIATTLVIILLSGQNTTLGVILVAIFCISYAIYEAIIVDKIKKNMDLGFLYALESNPKLTPKELAQVKDKIEDISPTIPEIPELLDDLD